MKLAFSKKTLAIITAASLVMTIGTTAFAASALKKVTAYQNANL
ncbi:hypothetical protein [Paenibacillus sp. 2TAB19]